MSDLIRSSGAWWAQSSRHARLTAIGTTAIVLVLGLITWNVWVSPAGSVSTAVHQALGVTPPKKKVSAAELQAKLTAAQQEIWSLEGKLDSSTAQAGSRGDQIAQLKAQLASLQSQLGSDGTGSGGASSSGGSAGGAKAAGSGNGASGPGGSGSGGSGPHIEPVSDGSNGSGTNGTSPTDGGTDPSGGSGGAPAPTTPPSTGTPTPSPSPSTGTPSPTPISTPTKAEILAQKSRWYGLYTTQAPFNWAEYDDVSRKVGEATNMVGYFQGFDQEFNANAVQRAWSNGRLPVMTWESLPAGTGNDVSHVDGYTNADIIDGNFDAYLKRTADAIKANGMPMVIRLDHEMNGDWYNWSDGDKQENAPGSYVAMWKHVHDVFQAEGANDQVIWLWSPTRIDNLGDGATLEHMASYYPGSDYVDWAGMSGYYRNSSLTPSFSNTFDATLAQIRAVAPGKKILLAEIGATESGGDGQKAEWMSSFFDGLADPENADILGFAYFNHVVTTVKNGTRVTNDWRLDSRRDSLEAFVQGIKRTDIDYDLQEVKQ
ncbi:glycosyl hydrolase [Curtobacterium sp. L1-20]|uniref:glycoside hydrolase family 26 protein n=1 Tax=Curtobacterium sp. L1-20 TaxID=3138181 RepID=UPI003B5294A9